MKNRIIDISERPCRLRVDHRQLVIDDGRKDSLFPYTVPLEDLAVVVVSHPQVTYSQAVLSELCEHGAAFVCCNRNRMPVGMLLPLDAHSVQTERFRAQLQMKLPLKKKLWKQLIQAKIRMQARLLMQVSGTDYGLQSMIPLVRSGDPSNVEARAAKKYWRALFGEEFRRDVDAENHNRFLNYGYAILRAATARAVCAAGLHPSLGVHHHNRYNSWCLADDVMEPFRPVVDQAVVSILKTVTAESEMSQSIRAQLIEGITERVFVDGRIRTVLDALSLLTASLTEATRTGVPVLQLPEEFAYAPV